MADPHIENRALGVRPVLAAWWLGIGIDLFFNAGLFASLFDQATEPGLLSNDELFRRVPVSYAALALAVVGLAWVWDRLGVDGWRRGAVLGAGAGVVASALGIVNVWTAIEMSPAFVGAGALVQVVELTAIGTALGRFRSGVDARVRWVVLAGVGAAVVGIVLQNVS